MTRTDYITDTSLLVFFFDQIVFFVLEFKRFIIRNSECHICLFVKGLCRVNTYGVLAQGMP